MAIVMKIFLPLIFLVLFTAISYSEEIDKPKQAPPERRAPPEFAVAACSGKKDGDTCQFQGPVGKENGTCRYTPDKKYFACKPERPPRNKDEAGQPAGQTGVAPEDMPPGSKDKYGEN